MTVIDEPNDGQHNEGQETALEKERRLRALYEFKTQQSKELHALRVETTKHELFTNNFERQLAATGISFNGPAQELKLIMEVKGTKFFIQNDGTFSLQQAGKEIAFQDAIEDFAVKNLHMVRDRSKLAHRLKSTEQLSKQNFGNDTRAKAKWISEHSLAEWEALPATRAEVVQRENLTAEIYKKASVKQKLAWGLSEREIAILLHTGRLPKDAKR